MLQGWKLINLKIFIVNCNLSEVTGMSTSLGLYHA